MNVLKGLPSPGSFDRVLADDLSLLLWKLSKVYGQAAESMASQRVWTENSSLR